MSQVGVSGYRVINRVGWVLIKKLAITLFPFSHKIDLLFPNDSLLFSHYSH